MKPIIVGQKHNKGGSVFASLLLGILLFFVTVGAYAVYEAVTFIYFAPGEEEPKDVTIDIKSGSTFDRVANQLYNAGAISSVDKFRIYAKYKNKLGSVQVGEFIVNTSWTPDRVLQQITTGRQTLDRLALREGLTWWQTAKLIENSGFASEAEFEAVIHDPVFLYQYGIPFPNAEGFLYPETYFLRKPKTLGDRTQAEALARILVETFWQRAWPLLVEYVKANPGPRDEPIMLPGFELRNDVPVRVALAMPPQTPNPKAEKTEQNTVPAEQQHAQPTAQAANIPVLQTPFTAKDLRYIITLASLVEKETGVPSERGTVAGVYANRLQRGMLLQCDPTIIYGIGKKQNGPIRRSQLNDAKNLYNTYQHPGLPPGPICSLGEASLRAAITPEKHAYLFFVATGKPDGTHTFSTNVKDHEKAVKVYRDTQRR